MAVRAGRVNEVQRLVESGADVDAHDALGSTPLHIAAWSGNTEIASFLLAHGADVNAVQAETVSTPLYYAVSRARTAMVKLLLAAGARVDMRYKNEETVLDVAASLTDPQIVELLLDARCNVNAIDGRDETALDKAVEYGKRDIVGLLIAHGATVKRLHSADGRGPLHEACLKGFAELIEPLIAAGADPCQPDRSGQTPFDLALAYKNTRVITVLLHAGGTWVKALQISAERAMEAASLRGEVELVDILIQAGLDINKPTSDGSTYLHAAALKGRIKVLKLLLDRGAKLDALNAGGGTALHDAALGGNTEAINLLLDHGAKIDVQEKESGATPLMLAASVGQTQAVALLLKRGANVAVRDYAGHTALDRAKEIDNASIIKLLEPAVVRSKARASNKSKA